MRLIPGAKIAHRSTDVPAVQEPEGLWELCFAQPLQTFVTVT